MPELPEVETIKLSLAPYIEGQTIHRVEVLQSKVVARPAADDFCRRLKGATFQRLGRRGKYLLMHLDQGRVLVVHFGMTGSLQWQAGGPSLEKHTHVLLNLDAGCLAYRDPRRFGRLWLVEDSELADIRGLRGLGPEPLDGSLSPEILAASLSGRFRPLKSLLLDQSFVAGIGNIYADEILHRAGLSPLRRADTLTGEQSGALAEAMRTVLEEGVAHRGTTIRNYVDGEGKAGENRRFLRVYGKTGGICPRCGGTVVRTRLAGRSTHYCPGCQH